MVKNIIVILALAFITLPLSSQNSGQREIYSFTYDGRSYEVVKEFYTWENAAAFAVERGGYLVEINNQPEQDAIYDAIINGAEVSPTYTSVSNGGGIAYVWIGATDQQNEGTWLWDGNNDNLGTNFWTGQGANGVNNGTAVDGAFFNWGGTSSGIPKEPDNYNSSQDYAAMGLAGWPSGTTNLGIAGEWNDIHGSGSIYSVIEYNSGTGVNDQQNNGDRDFCIYPNPTHAKISVGSTKAIRFLEIYNLRGQKIYEGVSREIDLSSRQKGIYLIRINDGKKYHTKKILLY